MVIFKKLSLEKIFQFFLQKIVLITPKTKIFVLRGTPDYEDNLIEVYSALQRRGFRKIIWILNEPNNESPMPLMDDTLLVKRGGVSDFYYSVVAKYIFITHGHFIRTIPKNQVCVNLWHGVPLKKIGKLQGLPSRSDSILVSTSEFTREIFFKSFNTPDKNIVITGQPRTDRMLQSDRSRVLKSVFDDSSGTRRLFVWLPTFRKSIHGKDHLDGTDFDNIFNCTNFSVERFDSLLIKHNATCLIKPHPLSVVPKKFESLNLVFIDESWLAQRSMTLYQLLGATDGLISDISSVIVDYILIDKPIILLFEDLEVYKQKRGFSLSPIEEYLPADISGNFEEFLMNFEAVLSGDDPHRAKRMFLKELYFKHSEVGAADRILDLISLENTLNSRNQS